MRLLYELLSRNSDLPIEDDVDELFSRLEMVQPPAGMISQVMAAVRQTPASLTINSSPFTDLTFYTPQAREHMQQDALYKVSTAKLRLHD